MCDKRSYELTPVSSGTDDNPGDVLCFVRSIEVDTYTPPSDCHPEFDLDDLDDDGFDETIAGGVLDARITYVLELAHQDEDGEPCGPPGEYVLHLDVVADGIATVASTELVIEVTE